MAKAEKSSVKPSVRALVPQPHGGALLPGAGGGRQPGSGRPPDEFKARLAAIASSDEALKYLDECIKGKHGSKAAASARDYATEHGFGKVVQSLEVSGPGGTAVLHEIIVTRRLTDGEA